MVYSFLLIYISTLFFLSRDNGITIIISKYQFVTELGSFITMMVLGLYNDGVTVKDNTKSIAFLRFTDIVNALVTYVILPFYFLNGDAAFRKRVIQKGWLRALQTALLGHCKQLS